MITLGAKIGVGSIAGVGLAIYLGGPGTIFWMWIISLLTSSNTFFECLIAKKFKENNNTGPFYYIKKGLTNDKLAKIYGALLIMTFIIGYNSIQSNTIYIYSKSIVKCPNYIFSIILSVLVFYILRNKLDRIINFTSILVPIMSILYLSISLIIVLINYNKIFYILNLIIKNAFNFKSISSSFIYPLIIGVERGIFNTESGIGTTSISCGLSNNNDKSEAFLQTFGVNFITFFISSLTAFIILLNVENISCVNGLEIVSIAFNTYIGNLSNIFLFIIIFMFAFSTIISGYILSEKTLKFFYPHISGKNILLFKFITVLWIFFSSMIDTSILWDTTDIFIGILGIINMYTLIKLKDVI